MTAKEELKRIRSLEDKIRTIRQKVEGLSGIDYARDRVQTSPGDSLADQLSDLAELEREYKRELVRILRKIDRMPREEHAAILRARYVRGEKWEQIAARMHYSAETVEKYHRIALKEYAKIN